WVAPNFVAVNVSPTAVIEPLRDGERDFGATSELMMPVPAPLAPGVIVMHAAMLSPVHAHSFASITAALPVPPCTGTDMTDAFRCGEHGDENEKVFDRSLAALPPGPTADTRASYSAPGAGRGTNRSTKSTRIFPSGAGFGFPRFTDMNG